MKTLDNFKDKTKIYLGKKVLNLVSDASDKNFSRILFLIEKLTPKSHKGMVIRIRELFDEGHPSLIFARNFLKNINRNCRDKFIVNFILNGLILNQKKRNAIVEKDFTVPFNVLISPTMRCNFRCKGCYAGDYDQKNDLSFELVDRVVGEGKELGVALYTILGGEPFIWKDLLKLFEKHNDAYFQVFTNGSFINEEVADKLVKLGNVAIMLSLGGFRDSTDEWRGKGTYDHLMKVMDILKSKGIVFGYSAVPTRTNVEEIMGDKFVDMMIDKGVSIGWYFLYMPIGKDPNLNFMPTPEQRKYMFDRDNHIRDTKPLFIIDFWNDAPLVGGCIAGKQYLHVTSTGDVEPCIFTHFAQDNIKDKSLKEVLRSDFFKAIRKRQPYNDNLFLPCMLIDNPEVIRELNKEVKIKPTHEGAEKLVGELKEGIDEYSKGVKKVFKPVWEEYKKKHKGKNPILKV